jgi:hypothetical protein
MSLKFDKDARAVGNYIQNVNPNAFNAMDPLAVVSARTELAELMLDARVDALVVHEGWKRDKAEEAVIADLEKSIA